MSKEYVYLVSVKWGMTSMHASFVGMFRTIEILCMFCSVCFVLQGGYSSLIIQLSLGWLS